MSKEAEISMIYTAEKCQICVYYQIYGRLKLHLQNGIYRGEDGLMFCEATKASLIYCHPKESSTFDILKTKTTTKKIMFDTKYPPSNMKVAL